MIVDTYTTGDQRGSEPGCRGRQQEQVHFTWFCPLSYLLLYIIIISVELLYIIIILQLHLHWALPRLWFKGQICEGGIDPMKCLLRLLSKVWDVSTGQCLFSMVGHDNWVRGRTLKKNSALIFSFFQGYPGTLVESSSSLLAMTNPFGWFFQYTYMCYLSFRLFD